ncbi:uncharacterized protein BDV14DRAFT_61247 [Aspergillus stella-maris]|uniref:uncharacterized protein n=1 Tax=Aspergillus stella-maris TaxID=1810926 RepID=UPI003CCD8C78
MAPDSESSLALSHSTVQLSGVSLTATPAAIFTRIVLAMPSPVRSAPFSIPLVESQCFEPFPSAPSAVASPRFCLDSPACLTTFWRFGCVRADAGGLVRGLLLLAFPVLQPLLPFACCTADSYRVVSHRVLGPFPVSIGPRQLMTRRMVKRDSACFA